MHKQEYVLESTDIIGSVITNVHGMRSKSPSPVVIKLNFKNLRFLNDQISIFKILGFVNLWIDNARLVLIRHQFDISQHAAIDWALVSKR